MDDSHIDSEILVQFVDGRLPADQRRQVAHHLAECRECSLVYLALHAAKARLAQPLPHRLAPAEEQMRRELMARYSGSPLRRTLRRCLLLVAAAAAALLLAFGFWGSCPTARGVDCSGPPATAEVIASPQPAIPEGPAFTTSASANPHGRHGF